MLTSVVTAADRYESLKVFREPFLRRARDCASVTIPSLVPPESATAFTVYPTPYQSVGARGVNNLASKMLLALLPPGSPFFREVLDPQLSMGMDPKDRDAIDEALSLEEQVILQEIEGLGIRVQGFEAFKQLIVAGNVLLNVMDCCVRLFPLPQFVCQRDPEGDVLEILVKEQVAPVCLPEVVFEAIRPQLAQDEKVVDLYTWVKREEDEWTVHQEVKGIVIPGTTGTYPLDKCPWLPLRWTRMDGESYGRGLCEQYLGDLNAMERLSLALIQAATASAKVVFLVNPNGLTRVDDLANAQSGDFVPGIATDVTVVRVEKGIDMGIAKQQADEIGQRISFAFLLNSAIQRNAERVTAEEVRYMASELEDALGGVYSVMSAEFQKPLVLLVKASLERRKKIPKLKQDHVKTTIVTGLDALGRNQQLNKLNTFIDGALQRFNTAVMPYLNMTGYLTEVATALGLDTRAVIKTEDQIAAEQQQQQQAALAQRAIPNVVNGMNQMMQNQMPQEPTEGGGQQP